MNWEWSSDLASGRDLRFRSERGRRSEPVTEPALGRLLVESPRVEHRLGWVRGSSSVAQSKGRPDWVKAWMEAPEVGQTAGLGEGEAFETISLRRFKSCSRCQSGTR